MKRLRNLLALMILAAIAAIVPAQKAQAGSRVYVGVDLGPVVAAFDTGPRYVYSPPVVYERPRIWLPPPPPPRAYRPVRWHHHQPPPPPHYDRYRHGRHHDDPWDDRYRR